MHLAHLEQGLQLEPHKFLTASDMSFAGTKGFPVAATKFKLDFASLLGPTFYMWIVQLLLPVSNLSRSTVHMVCSMVKWITEQRFSKIPLVVPFESIQPPLLATAKSMLTHSVNATVLS